jgi:hypothetical protein
MPNQDSLVINRPSAEGSNHSKLLQAIHIRSAGFLTPDWIVTNDLEDALRFQARHGRVVYKSMSSVRSIVKELQVEQLKGGDFGPAFLRERVNSIRALRRWPRVTV